MMYADYAIIAIVALSILVGAIRGFIKEVFSLAVWAAAKGGPDGEMGDWGEKVAWDAKNLKVTNVASLKTPGVADLVKPKYPEGYRLDS